MALKRFVLILTILLGSCLCGSLGVLYGQSSETEREDTIQNARFKVSKTVPEKSEDLNRNYSADLRTPENIQNVTEYDEEADIYKVGVKLGDNYLTTPFLMTQPEYNKWSMQRSMQSYFRTKNEEEFANNGTNK